MNPRGLKIFLKLPALSYTVGCKGIMKMDITPSFKKQMTKEEVTLLVDLVLNIPVITSKETNAATNKLKEEAWVTLADEFNSKSGYIPRNLAQLKLKWDNLKKAARKRAQQIRRINLKASGGKSEYIPPDEILDKVSALLGSCKANGPSDEVGLMAEESPLLHSAPVKRRRTEDVGATKHYGIPKITKPLHMCIGKEKDSGVKERNLAIARYYEKKTEKIDLEIQLLKCQLNNTKCSCNSPTPSTPIRWDDDDEHQK